VKNPKLSQQKKFTQIAYIVFKEKAIAEELTRLGRIDFDSFHLLIKKVNDDDESLSVSIDADQTPNHSTPSDANFIL
jgi:hypothetical protein